MIRIGIIGLGFMGKTHYGVYDRNPEAQVVAIADADARRASGDLSGGWGNVETGATADRLPMDRIKGTTDWRELLAMPEVDVVDICLPTPAHVEIVTAALAAGKHVVCEKPLARTSADARTIADAAARAKGFFMPAMCMRFWPEWEWIKHAVDERRYGNVLAATFRRLGSYPAGWFMNGAMSGGALLDLHIHDTDFVYHLFGKPRGVFSRGYRAASGELDHVVTQYLYDAPGTGAGAGGGTGPLVTAEGGWTMSAGFPFTMKLTVVFERATADFDMARKDATLMLFADGKGEVVPHATHDGWTGELAYFLECVKTGQRPQRVTAEDAVAGIQITEAEGRSVASGRVEAV
jgi:predicted dehydrogenase